MSSPWRTSPQASICSLPDALRREKLLERVAAFRRIAQPERLLRGGGQAAVAQIGAGLGAGRRLKLVLEELRRQFHHVDQAGALLLALFGPFVARRHRHAGKCRDALDGFRKAHAFEFGQEPEMVARDAAAETMVAALLVLAVEGRALLAMERAAGPIVAARRVGLLPVPRDALADHR